MCMRVGHVIEHRAGVCGYGSLLLQVHYLSQHRQSWTPAAWITACLSTKLDDCLDSTWKALKWTWTSPVTISLDCFKVAVHPRGPRKRCVSLYIHIQREIHACAWGQNNSPVLHFTVFIHRLRLIELLWSAGTHGKALPSKAERRARRLVQRDGSPYAV